MNWDDCRVQLAALFFGMLIAYSIMFVTFAHGETLPEAAMVNAHKYLYVREATGQNDAPEIDRMLAYLGLPPRLSWCAAFVVNNHHEAADARDEKQPLPRIGRVARLWATAKANPIRFKTITTDQVRLGLIKLQPGDLPVWKHGAIINGDFNGHIGHVVKQASNSHIVTIEGNTLPEGKQGSQREGGGVYVRNRYIAPGTFSIIGFIRP